MPGENPILNNPYEEPRLHYATNLKGELDYDIVRRGRRIFSPDIQSIPVRSGPQKDLFKAEEIGDAYATELVNLVRQEVGRWRSESYPNTTRVSRELLHYWFLDSTRENRLFFAQREAIETAIWLNEVAERSNPGQHILRQLSLAQSPAGAPPAATLPRIAFKMATGAGKTVVMAALIAYHYRIARQVHEGEISPKKGVHLLSAAGVNPSSARNYIYGFRSMMEGAVYKRAMSTGATDYFLGQIKEAYGPRQVAKAVTALRQHIKYKGGAMPGYVAIANKYDIRENNQPASAPKVAGLQILPMSVGEFDGQSIAEVQEEYFLDRLPHGQKGSYLCYTLINAPLGSIVLFQYDGHIVATGKLINRGPLPKKDADGYTHELVFDPVSIRVFEPIDSATICEIWSNVKGLNQASWKLSTDGLSVFEGLLRNVRVPALHPADATNESTEGSSDYAPSGIDSRSVVNAQIRMRRGQAKFRKSLFHRYGAKCLVTGCSIAALLEAAHISPFRGEGDNHVENGLLLRADIHTLFDLNLLGIEPDTLRIELHPSIRIEYEEVVGKKLLCQSSKAPSPAALEVRYAEYQKFCLG